MFSQSIIPPLAFPVDAVGVLLALSDVVVCAAIGLNVPKVASTAKAIAAGTNNHTDFFRMFIEHYDYAMFLIIMRPY
ncbi:hypothetical protein Ngar_c10700 [Candidatus Nitrososphaera gargensis Ga9.2]|uniref:Uncharacterized protein n=1 Tax=Nitrososphaera gargensis (strain Ga9.2) TaxID=1237085 RepID=K0IIS5_NITGG|nr:hypothetical protein Ngar_c10700 [Candidatus Nitrososphaera gargensis Ga9.2]